MRKNYNNFFDNKTILITGASTGIGKAVTEILAESECKIFIISRKIELLKQLKNNLSQKKAKIYPVQCDVGNKDQVIQASNQINQISQKIDVAILNAGIGINMKVENFSSEAAEKIFSTNVFGVIYWLEQLLPQMIKSRFGIIAGVSSIADNRGYSRSGFYCSSKAALTLYLEGLRGEVRKYGIKIITVKPGFVKTPLTDKNDFSMPFIMKSEKAAKIILKGIVKGKRIIQFPLPTVISTKIIGMVPERLFQWGDDLYQ